MDTNKNLGITIRVYDHATKKLKSFEQSVASANQKLRQFQTNMEKIDKASKSSLDGTKKEINQASQNVEKMGKKSEQAAKGSDKFSKANRKAGQSVGDFRKSQEKAISTNKNWLSGYSESIGIAVRSVAIWGAATTAIYGSKRALETMAETVRDVDTEMVSLIRVMDETTTNFNELQDSAANLGVNMASNISNVVESMVGWARQGREQIEVVELTRAALLASNVAQMEASESVDLLTSAILQFNMEASDAVEVVDRWNEVANNFAVTAQDIAMSIRESGAAATNAGVSMDELIGITTSLSATTAKSGNRIGRALRTIFSRILGDSNKAGEALGKVEVQLNQMGISLRKSEDDYRSLTDVLTDVASQWHEIDNVMQANIARAIGGRRRYSDVISLIENWDMALDATITSMSSLNSAMEENESYMESIEAQWKSARAEFERTALIFGEEIWKEATKSLASFASTSAKEFGNIITGVSGLVSSYQELNETIPLTETILVSLAGVLQSAVIPAITAVGTVLAAHPIVATITAVSVATLSLSRRFGEQERATKQLEKAQDSLNTAKEKTNSLTTLEVNNTRELISEYEDMAQSLLSTQEEIDNMNNEGFISPMLADIGKNMQNWIDDDSGLGSIVGWFTEFPMIVGSSLSETIASTAEYEEQINELRETFAELDKEGESNEEFLTRLLSHLNGLDNALDNSLGTMSKYTMEQVEMAKQGYRELQMLEAKQDRYEELIKIEDKNIAQEQEMRSLMIELASDFYELEIGADNFGSVLDNIVNNQMQKYGQEGEVISDVMNKLEGDLTRLDEIQPDLALEHDAVGREIDALREKLEGLEENTPEWHKTTQELDEHLAEYEKLGEQYDLTSELQAKFNEALTEFEEGIEGIDTDEFLSNFAEAINVFEALDKELNAVVDTLNYMEKTVSRDLEFDRFISGILGEDVDERLEREQSTLESYVDDTIELMDTMWNGLDPESPDVVDDVQKVINDMEGVDWEDLDVDVDYFRNQWNEDSFQELKAQVIDKGAELLEDYNNQLNEKSDDLEIAKILTDVMDLEKEDIPTLDDSVLQEYEKQFEALSEAQAKAMQSGSSLGEMLGVEGLELDFAMQTAIEDELVTREIADELSNGLNEILSTADLEMEMPEFTDETASERVKQIVDVMDEALKELTELEGVDFAGMSVSELEEYRDKFGENSDQISQIIDVMTELGEIDRFVGLNFDEIANDLGLTAQEAENLEAKFGQMAINQQLRNQLSSKEIELMGEYRQQVAETSIEISDFSAMLDKTTDPEIVSRIEAIVGQLEQQKEMYEAMVALSDAGVSDDFLDFESDMNVTGVLNTLSQIKSQFASASAEIDNIIEGFDLTTEQAKELKEEFGLSEEDYKEAVEDLDSRLVQLAQKWGSQFEKGVQTAVDNLDDAGLGEAFGKVLGTGIAGILADEETFQATFEGLSHLLDKETEGWDEIVSDPVTQGVMAGAEAVVSGGSAGDVLFSGLGTAIGATMGDKIGAEIGSAIGSAVAGIGEAIFGGTKGEEAMEHAKELNEGLSDASDTLSDFNIQTEHTLADMEEVASAGQALFGGSDWEVSGIIDAERQLEEMEELLEMAENVRGTLESGLKSAITDATSYHDMRRQFQATIGQALMDTFVESFIQSAFIEDQLDRLAGNMATSVRDGLDQAEIDEFAQNFENIMTGATSSGILEMLEEIRNITGVNVDRSQRQTFQAGETTAVTYHNQFIVQSQAFNGSKSDAKSFARMLAPFINEEIQRGQGN